MNPVCPDPLPSGHCCFQGTLSIVEIHGKAGAEFITSDALSNPSITSISFSPPISIQKGGVPINGIHALGRPDEIDALPFVSQGRPLAYRVSYQKTSPEPKFRVQLSLDQAAPTDTDMALAFSGPLPNKNICSSEDACRLIWPPTQTYGLEVGYGGDGPGLIIPKDFENVQSVRLHFQSGTLRCRSESGELSQPKVSSPLYWNVGESPENTKTLRVGGIRVDREGLHAEVLATGLKTPGLVPKAVLYIGTAGIGFLVLGLLLWFLRRPKKTLRVCISHAPEDHALLAEFENALSKRNKTSVRILSWDAGKLGQDQDHTQEMVKQMEQADRIVLMLSADYLGSDALYQESLQAIRLHKEKGKRLVQVLARPCFVYVEPYKDIESLPKDKQAIALREPNQDRWKDVVEALLQGPDGG